MKMKYFLPSSGWKFSEKQKCVEIAVILKNFEYVKVDLQCDWTSENENNSGSEEKREGSW